MITQNKKGELIFHNDGHFVKGKLLKDDEGTLKYINTGETIAAGDGLDIRRGGTGENVFTLRPESFSVGNAYVTVKPGQGYSVTCPTYGGTGLGIFLILFSLAQLFGSLWMLLNTRQQRQQAKEIIKIYNHLESIATTQGYLIKDQTDLINRMPPPNIPVTEIKL